MKIVVLNGSPKGMLSMTFQYVRFIEKRFAQHDFQIIHVCREGEGIEKDEHVFRRIIDAVRGAEGVMWVFPVYTFLVPALYKRFIELVFANSAEEAFRGKYAAALTTSIHFFDHTAHNYVHAVSEDLGMSYAGSYSARPYDLLEENEKRRLLQFVQGFIGAIEQRRPTARIHDPVRPHRLAYSPSPAKGDVDLDGKRLIVLTDSNGAATNVAKMVDRLRMCFTNAPEVVNLHEVKICSGCDGCFQCGAEGRCVYRQADDVEDLYLAKLVPADIVVMAGTIQDRYLSSRWKLFFDRGFFRPLIPWFPNKQLAFVVSGPLKQLPNLRQILEAYAEFHQGNLAGIVTDESEQSGEIDSLLDALAAQLASCAKQGYVKPQTFLGIGGTKIFRDDTYGFLRPVFQVAHQYFRRHGIYDFPQNDLRTRMMSIGGMLMTRVPGFRKRFFRTLKTQMVKCLQEEVEKEGQERKG
jgi:multimeric flavodoxin WrbA